MTSSLKAFFTAFATILALGLSSIAFAHSYHVGPVAVEHPWSPASLPGTTTGSAYMKITNTGTTPIVLVGAATPAAARVELHTMSMDGGIMRMRPVSSIPIAPKSTIVFGPTGLHMMLIGLGKPLEAETLVPMTLNFQGAPAVSIELYVEESPMGDMHHH